MLNTLHRKSRVLWTLSQDYTCTVDMGEQDSNDQTWKQEPQYGINTSKGTISSYWKEAKVQPSCQC